MKLLYNGCNNDNLDGRVNLVPPNFASPLALVGALPCGSHKSHTSFISLKSAMCALATISRRSKCCSVTKSESWKWINCDYTE